MAKFKVGEKVRGNAGANIYHRTNEGYRGVVASYNPAYSDKVEIVDEHGDKYWVLERCFDSVSKPKTLARVKTEMATAKKSSAPQAFIEELQVRIARIDGGYWDVSTEDYVGELGTITRYLDYDSEEGCYAVQIRMEDGEVLEVLESEIMGFKMPVNKSKPKVAAPVKEMYTPVYDCKPQAKVGTPKVPIKREAPAKFDNMVKTFDLTPKKKVRKSIFNP